MSRRSTAFSSFAASKPMSVVAGVLAVALVVTGVELVQIVKPRSASAAKPEDVTSRPDATSARIAARLLGHKVEILDQRTETDQTWVNPDGSYTTEMYAGAQRVRQADGSFKKVDLKLQDAADGSLHPVASVADTTFSGGGDTEAASLQTGNGEEVGLGWLSKLPTPTVSGSVATYQINATTQLLLSTTGQGFSAHLKLSAPPTSPLSYKLPLRLTKLVASQDGDGAITLKDTKGKVQSRAPTFTMWDSQVDQVGDPTNVATVDTSLTTGGTGKKDLQLQPSMAWLTDPATKYPVTIDPNLAKMTGLRDTYVYTGNTSALGSVNRLQIGTEDSGAHLAYSYLQWDTSKLQNGLGCRARPVRVLRRHLRPDDTGGGERTDVLVHRGRDGVGQPAFGDRQLCGE